MSTNIRRLAQGRSIARRCVMQGLYQWQMTQQPAAEIERQFVNDQESRGADFGYFGELLQQCVERHEALDALIAPYIDRPVEQLDPVEHAILLLGAYELEQRLDVPYRVVINEGVELSKRFGATDGHRYINAVLDKAAKALRAPEQKG